MVLKVGDRPSIEGTCNVAFFSGNESTLQSGEARDRNRDRSIVIERVCVGGGRDGEREEREQEKLKCGCGATQRNLHTKRVRAHRLRFETNPIIGAKNGDRGRRCKRKSKPADEKKRQERSLNAFAQVGTGLIQLLENATKGEAKRPWHVLEDTGWWGWSVLACMKGCRSFYALWNALRAVSVERQRSRHKLYVFVKERE